MKGFLRILFGCVLLFAVSSVMASGFVHKVEISKHSFCMHPAVVDHQEIKIERVDNEVLVIRNENEAVTGLSRQVRPVAHAPPKARY